MPDSDPGTRAVSEQAYGLLGPRLRAVLSVGPAALFGLVLVLIYLLEGWRPASFVLAAAGGSFVGAGKFVILAGTAAEAPYGVWILAGLVVYCDVGTALFLLANSQSLYRAPWVGRRLVRVREIGWQMLRQHPWMRRFTWVAVVALVAAPFQGTGAVLGTILSRLLGFSHGAGTAAIALGSSAGALSLALAAYLGSAQLEAWIRRPEVLAILVALILGGGWAAGRSITRRRAK